MVQWSTFTCPEFSWIRRFEQVFRDNKTLCVIAAVCYLVIQQFHREPKGTLINGFFRNLYGITATLGLLAASLSPCSENHEKPPIQVSDSRVYTRY